MEPMPCVFKCDLSESLKCLLCRAVFCEPVLASGCGHSFCKTCTNDKERCPKDNKEFQYLIPNITLYEQINQLEIHCRYGCKLSKDNLTYEIDTDGCTEIIKFCNRNAHESICSFSFVSCPQSPQCPPIRQKDLSCHLEFCQKSLCPHSKFGCLFRGINNELDIHLKTCHYEALKEYLIETENKITELNSALNLTTADLASVKVLLSDFTKALEHSSNSSDNSIRSFENEIYSLQRENLLLKEHMNNLNEFVTEMERQFEVMVFQQNVRCLGTLVGHQGPVWCLVAYGDHVFSCSGDKTIKVWNMSSDFACIKTMEGHTDSILCLTIINKKLYSGGKDNKIGEWCLDTLTNLLFVNKAHSVDYVSTLASCDPYLFSGSNGSLKIWRATELMKGAIFEINDLNIWVRCISCKDDLLYIGIDKIQIRSLKTSIKDKLQYSVVSELNFPKPDSHVHSMAFVDRFLLSGTSTGEIYIWDYNKKELINILGGHTERINNFSCMLIGGVWRVFSASNDRTIRMWRMDHMICTQILARHQGSVQSIVWWKGRLFSGAVDTSIKVWVAGC